MFAAIARPASFAVALALLSACGGDSPTSPPTPSNVAAVGSSTLTGTVGQPVAQPPRVKVTSTDGTPVSGVPVTFAVTGGGGSITGASATTDASGIATLGSWTLGTTAGANTLTATATGVTGTVTFTATAQAGPAATITFSRDSVLLDQWGDTATVTAQAKDQYGNTVASPAFTWSSPDANVSTVNGGLVTSVRAGRTLLQATVGTSTQATIPARVVLQRNAACIAPTAPARGAHQGAPAYAGAEIQTQLASPTHDGYRTLALDYDGDGDQDVVRLEYSYPTSNPYTGTTRVFKNDGGVLRDSSAAVLLANVIPDHPRDFEIRDFTGDGVPDVYVAQHGFDANPFPGAPNLLFTRSGDRLAQVAAQRFTGMENDAFSHGSSSADVDCDGDMDIMELNVSSNAPHYLWINGGTGTFTAAPTSKIQPLTGTDRRWQEVAFIDFDADGDPDMYLGSAASSTSADAFLVNDGFGNFRSSSAITFPAPRFSPTHDVNNAKAADFNGDGREDLILFEIPQPFSTSSAIRLWQNQGNGSFTDVSTAWGLPATCTAEIIEPLYVQDMNGDGWPDVILPQGCPSLGGTAILFNRGTTFDVWNPSSIESWLNNDTMTPIDVNGDGKMDLFFGDRGGNPVVVRRQ